MLELQLQLEKERLTTLMQELWTSPVCEILMDTIKHTIHSLERRIENERKERAKENGQHALACGPLRYAKKISRRLTHYVHRRYCAIFGVSTKITLQTQAGTK